MANFFNSIKVSYWFKVDMQYSIQYRTANDMYALKIQMCYVRNIFLTKYVSF